MIDFGIIAAGDGNRIKKEGSLLPKPLVKIDNEPMIGRLISLMENCGANSISIIVNSDMPDVWEYLQGLVPNRKCELKMISAKTPSSMHSFFHLLNLMQPEDKFVVTTVDTIFRGDDFKKYTDYFINATHDIDGVMGVTSYVDDEKPLYVETDSENIITAFSDTPVVSSGNLSSTFVSAGIYGLRKNSIPILQNCIDKGVNRMRNFQRKLVEEGLTLKAYNLGKVLDVDHLLDIEKANSFLA